jgi:hypothetical protein
MAKSYFSHRTNKNSATPCVVHKKMLSLMASVCAFFASTKVVPVFHFAALQSKLSTSSLAQLAVGSRRYISPSFRFSSFWFISLAPHSRKNFAELIFPFRFPLAGSRLFFLFYFESYSFLRNKFFLFDCLEIIYMNQTIYPLHTAS